MIYVDFRIAILSLAKRIPGAPSTGALWPSILFRLKFCDQSLETFSARAANDFSKKAWLFFIFFHSHSSGICVIHSLLLALSLKGLYHEIFNL